MSGEKPTEATIPPKDDKALSEQPKLLEVPPVNVPSRAKSSPAGDSNVAVTSPAATGVDSSSQSPGQSTAAPRRTYAAALYSSLGLSKPQADGEVIRLGALPEEDGKQSDAALTDTPKVPNGSSSNSPTADKPGSVLSNAGRRIRNALVKFWNLQVSIATKLWKWQLQTLLSIFRLILSPVLILVNNTKIVAVFLVCLMMSLILGNRYVIHHAKPTDRDPAYRCLAEYAVIHPYASTSEIINRCRIDNFATYAHADQLQLYNVSEIIVNQCYALSDGGKILQAVAVSIGDAQHERQRAKEGKGDSSAITAPDLSVLRSVIQPLHDTLRGHTSGTSAEVPLLMSSFRSRLLAFSKAHATRVALMDRELAAITQMQRPGLFDWGRNAVHRRIERGNVQKWKALARFYDRMFADLDALKYPAHRRDPTTVSPDSNPNADPTTRRVGLLPGARLVATAASAMVLDPRFKALWHEAARARFLSDFLGGAFSGWRWWPYSGEPGPHDAPDYRGRDPSTGRDAYTDLDTLLVLADNLQACNDALHAAEALLHRLLFRASIGRYLAGGASLVWLRDKFPHEFVDEEQQAGSEGGEGKDMEEPDALGPTLAKTRYAPPRWPWSLEAETNHGVPLFRGLSAIEGMTGVWK